MKAIVIGVMAGTILAAVNSSCSLTTKHRRVDMVQANPPIVIELNPEYVEPMPEYSMPVVVMNPPQGI